MGFDGTEIDRLLNDALRQTGGPPTSEERKWADALLHPPEGKLERRKGNGSRGTSRNRAA